MGCCEVKQSHKHSQSNVEIISNNINNEELDIEYESTNLKLQNEANLNEITNNVHSTEKLNPQKNIEKAYYDSFISNKDKSKFYSTIDKLLTLVVIESKYILLNEEFIITKDGLINSMRKQYDGCTYFGNYLDNDTIKNDYNFPDKEKVGPKAFIIKYNQQRNDYFIKDLKGSGLFIKINNNFPFKLRHNTVFSFVNSHVLVQFPNESNQSTTFHSEKENFVIKLNIVTDSSPNQVYVFTKNDKITIGRKREKQTCNIEIDNSTVSRLQCTIYQKDNNWYLVDSDGGITNETMNGTWVLAEEYYQITNNTIFRSGTTIFKCMIKIKAI
jgi:hypothetical protein